MSIRQNLSPKLVFLTYFSKDSMKNVLKIYKSIVIESLKLVSLSPIKRWAIKVFAKLHKSPILIANTIRFAAADLRQFLETESP